MSAEQEIQLGLIQSLSSLRLVLVANFIISSPPSTYQPISTAMSHLMTTIDGTKSIDSIPVRRFWAIALGLFNSCRTGSEIYVSLATHHIVLGIDVPRLIGERQKAFCPYLWQFTHRSDTRQCWSGAIPDNHQLSRNSCPTGREVNIRIESFHPNHQPNYCTVNGWTEIP